MKKKNFKGKKLVLNIKMADDEYKKHKMFAQIRALGETKLWNFIKEKIEKEYNIEVNLLRIEIGFKGEYKTVKKICLESCTKLEKS